MSINDYIALLMNKLPLILKSVKNVKANMLCILPTLTTTKKVNGTVSLQIMAISIERNLSGIESNTDIYCDSRLFLLTHGVLTTQCSLLSHTAN